MKPNLPLLMALKKLSLLQVILFLVNCLGGRMSRILDGMVTESGILSAFCNICQRFKSETGSLSGTVEVTYVSLKSVYSIQDRWDCPKSYIHTFILIITIILIVIVIINITIIIIDIRLLHPRQVGLPGISLLTFQLHHTYKLL